jgi:hypothetical protein
MNRNTKHVWSVVFCLAILLLSQVAVAADLNGKWNFVFFSENGEHPREIVLTTSGSDVTGKLGEETYKGTLKNGALEMSGEHYAAEAGYKATLKMSGKLEGDTIKGKANWDMYDLTFKATKAK